MGKLHVFEEIDHRKGVPDDVAAINSTTIITLQMPTVTEYPILRRLTDAEVEGLLISQEILKTHSRTVGAIWWDDIAMKWQSAPKPADDERERFIRETAARMLPYCAERYNGPDWEEKAVSACIKHAESLAARLFGEGRA